MVWLIIGAMLLIALIACLRHPDEFEQVHKRERALQIMANWTRKDKP